jgi:hypothetical protein
MHFRIQLILSSFSNKVKLYFLRCLSRVSVTSRAKKHAWQEDRPLRQFVPHQSLQLVEKCLFVLKIPVHRRKSHVGDLVQLP